MNLLGKAYRQYFKKVVASDYPFGHSQPWEDTPGPGLLNNQDYEPRVIDYKTDRADEVAKHGLHKPKTPNGVGQEIVVKNCPDCKGRKVVNKKTCTNCKGVGRVQVRTLFTKTFPYLKGEPKLRQDTPGTHVRDIDNIREEPRSFQTMEQEQLMLK